MSPSAANRHSVEVTRFEVALRHHVEKRVSHDVLKYALGPSLSKQRCSPSRVVSRERMLI